MRYGVRYIVGVAGFLAATAALAGDLHVEVMPVYTGNLTQSARSPMKITVTNDGPATAGTVRLDTQSFHMDYPVSLPARSTVDFEAYPYLTWGDTTATLVTPRGRDLARYQSETGYQGWQPGVLFAGGVPGSLSYIRQAAGNQGSDGFCDLYCSAADLPTRPIGYEGLCAIVLDPAIRSLSPEQVRALQLYVVTGGTLVFNGGESASWNERPWAASLLPAKNFRAGSTATLDLPWGPSATGLPPVSVTLADPASGAHANHVLGGRVSSSGGAYALQAPGELVSVVKPLGLGRSIYYSFDLSQEGVAKWPGMAAFVQSQHWSNALTGSAFFQRYTAAATPSQVSAAQESFPPSASASDPFSARLPSSSFIFELLASYFVVVVPLNFLVLKRMRRGEWAWFTAPLLSLAFAGLLFHSAQGLYSAKMSQATRGLMVTQEGIPDAEFIGATQMFIPSAGDYDLHLKNVDSVGVANSVPGDQQIDIGASPELKAIDDGSVSAPKMIARNLSFREITFAQIYPAGSWVQFQVRKQGSHAMVTVRNASPYTISHAQLLVGGNTVELPDLAAGAQKTVRASLTKSGPSSQASAVPMVDAAGRRIALDGVLNSLEPGPKVGAEVPARRSIELLAFASTEVKK